MEERSIMAVSSIVKSLETLLKSGGYTAKVRMETCDRLLHLWMQEGIYDGISTRQNAAAREMLSSELLSGMFPAEDSPTCLKGKVHFDYCQSSEDGSILFPD